MKLLLNTLFFSLLVFGLSLEAKENAQQILSKVKSNTGSSFEDLKLQMEIFKKGEKLERDISIKKVEDKDSTKSLVKIHSPTKLKGIGIYSEIAGDSEQQWLYLPSLKKSRRVLQGNRKSSFLDSHLNFEDFSADMYRAYNSKIKSQDKKFWVIESTPKSKDATYSKIVTKVYKNKYLIKEVEYYNASGKLEKKLQASKFKKFGSIWRATNLVVGLAGSKDKTVLKVKKLSTKKFSSAMVSRAKLEE